MLRTRTEIRQNWPWAVLFRYWLPIRCTPQRTRLTTNSNLPSRARSPMPGAVSAGSVAGGLVAAGVVALACGVGASVMTGCLVGGGRW
jgi:hypothetical protein